ncbi:hypothetical protein AAG906_025640 [Vitis piasezkii]
MLTYFRGATARHHHFMAVAISLAQVTLFSKPSILLHRNAIIGFSFSIPFSSSSAHKIQTHKWRQRWSRFWSLVESRLAEMDDPTNNVPDAIFLKLGMQLHRRDQHPIGILKNAIYDYFDANYSNKFDKLDDLCPIVSTKENFDDVLVPPDHISRSYNDTYYIDSQTVLRCHTSAHQAELLRRGHTHFLVTGDMEGVRVFFPGDWETSGMDGTPYAAEDLKKCLDGLAQHLFGNVEMHWIDTYFLSPTHHLNLDILSGMLLIWLVEKWLEVLGCGVTEQEILQKSGKTGNVAWAFGLGLERLAMVLFGIPDIRFFWSTDERLTSQFSKDQLGVKFKPFSKYPPCYKDMSFGLMSSQKTIYVRL